jgi:hypothetical protein
MMTSGGDRFGSRLRRRRNFNSSQDVSCKHVYKALNGTKLGTLGGCGCGCRLPAAVTPGVFWYTGWGGPSYKRPKLRVLQAAGTGIHIQRSGETINRCSGQQAVNRVYKALAQYNASLSYSEQHSGVWTFRALVCNVPLFHELSSLDTTTPNLVLCLGI